MPLLSIHWDGPSLIGILLIAIGIISIIAIIKFFKMCNNIERIEFMLRSYLDEKRQQTPLAIPTNQANEKQ